MYIPENLKIQIKDYLSEKSMQMGYYAFDHESFSKDIMKIIGEFEPKKCSFCGTSELEPPKYNCCDSWRC